MGCYTEFKSFVESGGEIGFRMDVGFPGSSRFVLGVGDSVAELDLAVAVERTVRAVGVWESAGEGTSIRHCFCFLMQWTCDSLARGS